MSPKFNHEDRVVMSRLFVMARAVDRDDFIICRISVQGESLKVIKRLVGLPGEIVSIHGGRVYINGEALDEPYIYGQTTDGDIDLTLGSDEYFILGDNRQSSVDSRDFGVVKRKAMIGKIVFKF